MLGQSFGAALTFFVKGVSKVTGKEKGAVHQMRKEGLSYSVIAASLGISVNTIKSFCRRSGICPNTALPIHKPVTDTLQGNFCKSCGKKLRQKPLGKPRIFCSVECRRGWWKINNVSPNRKAYYCLICSCCGKEFESYGNGSRKYCSHACYIQDRFNVKEVIFDDARAV